VSTHDAFGYFSARYGLQFIAPQGVSTEAEASARDIARIIDAAKREKVGAVFLENIADPRLAQSIAAETGAKIGGTLYSDALSDAKGRRRTISRWSGITCGSWWKRWGIGIKPAPAPSLRGVQRRSNPGPP